MVSIESFHRVSAKASATAANIISLLAASWAATDSSAIEHLRALLAISL